MEAHIHIFSGSNSTYLAHSVANDYGIPLGQIELQRFSDGEMQPSILQSVRRDFVFAIQTLNTPADNIVELLLMVDALKRASAEYITVVIPYFGYGRQDRKDRPRVSIGSKLLANLITAAGANRVMTMDLHAPQIQGFFDIPVDHLESNSIFYPYIESLNLPNLTFASPDVGGTNRARAYAQYFNADLVLCDKYRKKANEVAGMTVIGDVKDKDILLIDDICDTARTLSNAANILLQKGARSVRAVCTHPVLSGKAVETINNSPLTELVVCDTIPMKESSPKIKVLSVSALFAHAIRNLIERRSISSLFLKQRQTIQ